jgi:hypothetical protein
MDDKIIKYKSKKKKLENKLFDILDEKKKIYLAKILFSINKIKYIENLNQFLKIKKTQNNQYDNEKKFIVVSGIYGSGKSTLIKHLENYFGQTEIVAKIHLQKQKDIEIFNELFKNIDEKINSSGIVLIELSINDDICYNNLLSLINIFVDLNKINDLYLLNIDIKANKQNYKNNLINKMFNDINQFNNNHIDVDVVDVDVDVVDVDVVVDVVDHKHKINDINEIEDKNSIMNDFNTNFNFILNNINKNHNSISYQEQNFFKLIKQENKENILYDFDFLDKYIEQIINSNSLNFIDLELKFPNIKLNIDNFYFTA